MYEILIGSDPRPVFTELKTEQEALDLIASTLRTTRLPVTVRREFGGAIVALVYNSALYRPACDMQEEAQP
jgi:hypothetical protein